MTARILTLPSADYHADQVADRPSLSASIIHTLCTSSPAHAKAAHPKLNPAYVREEEDKFSLGNAAHALFLEGEAGVAVIPYDDWRTNAAREQRDEARAYGRIPMLAKHWAECEAMVDAVRAQIDGYDIDPPLFRDGKPEQTLVWTDPLYGVPCRARLDWLRDDHTAIDDLKTTRASANPEQWSRTMFGFGADVQVAFYLRGLAAVTGNTYDASAFRYVVVEAAAPYAMSVVSLAPDAYALAVKKCDYAVEKWARCLRDDAWPGYPQRVAYAQAPPWLEAAWLERELREVAA